MNGLLNVYKEKGFTSHDVVAKLRRICHMKKIGHTGTLDPDAEGVLPVCLGSATKACELLTDKEKIYRTVLLLGQTTDTQDISGQVLKVQPVETDNHSIKNVINSFVGTYAQIPPMYSALKVNGKKLYELAREGIVIERKPREVQIFEIQIEQISLPRITMTVRCSKGTYIRTLCQDIGEKLGCGGCMESLLRIKSGIFDIESAYKLDYIQQMAEASRLEEIIIPTEQLFLQYPSFVVLESYRKRFENGNCLPIGAFQALDDIEKKYSLYVAGMHPELIRVYDKTEYNLVFFGIYKFDAGKEEYKPWKLFGQR